MMDDTLDKLKATYKTITTEALSLAKIISDYEKTITYDVSTGIKGEASIESTDTYMKITVNNIPGKIALYNNIGTKYHEATKNYWIDSIMYAVENMDEGKRIFFDTPVVIIIKINYKDVIWDVDNHFVGMVINGIRYSGLIDDDNFKKVKYFVMGGIADNENYNTEIYIVEDSSFIKLYNIIR